MVRKYLIYSNEYDDFIVRVLCFFLDEKSLFLKHNLIIFQSSQWMIAWLGIVLIMPIFFSISLTHFDLCLLDFDICLSTFWLVQPTLISLNSILSCISALKKSTNAFIYLLNGFLHLFSISNLIWYFFCCLFPW